MSKSFSFDFLNPVQRDAKHLVENGKLWKINLVRIVRALE